MYQLCRHILPHGRRCTQPAVGGKVYCRHHQVIQRTKEASVFPPKLRGLNRPLAFLYPEDRASITANAFLVLRALDDGRIDTHTANTMNTLLRTCQSNLNRGPLHQSGEPASRRRNDDWFDDDSTPAEDAVVHHVVLTPDGQELAPIAEAWERSEKQNHGEQCPCRQCARQYRHAAPEMHHAQCECADCAIKSIAIPAQGSTENEAEEPASSASSKNAQAPHPEQTQERESAEHEGSESDRLEAEDNDRGHQRQNADQESPVSGHGFSHVEIGSQNEGALAPANGSPGPEIEFPVPDPLSLVPALAPEPWMRPVPPREPLVLTPEEEERFKKLESRYIHDPKLADHIRETYRQLREERLAAEELKPQSTAGSPTICPELAEASR